MAQHKSKAFWERQVAALGKSGLTRAVYCRRAGLSYSAMTAWERRLRSADLPEQAAPLLVPVMVEDAVPCPAPWSRCASAES